MDRLKETIVVKVGTDTITENRHLNGVVMADIARQISELRNKGIYVILVSSGAIGAARSILPQDVDNEVRNMKQGLSSIGQTMLMGEWMGHFGRHGIICAQGLLQERDFACEEGVTNMRRALGEIRQIENALDRHIVPIINGNDLVTHGPIDFDNDKIAGCITETAGAHDLVFLTNVDGLFDKNPSDPTAHLIREVRAGVDKWANCISKRGSKNGTGNMHSKCSEADRLARIGKQIYMGNGAVRDAIFKLLNREIGTWFHV